MRSAVRQRADRLVRRIPGIGNSSFVGIETFLAVFLSRNRVINFFTDSSALIANARSVGWHRPTILIYVAAAKSPLARILPLTKEPRPQSAPEEDQKNEAHPSAGKYADEQMNVDAEHLELTHDNPCYAKVF